MILETFGYGFVQRALLAGLLLAVTAGVLSPFVVLRRLSFSADGLAHASLGGLAVGMFFTGDGPVPAFGSYAISMIFTCGVAGLIAFLSDGRRVQADSAIGACYVTAFSFGIVLLALKQRSSGHLEHFFFGSLLSVTGVECGLLGCVAFATILLVTGCWQWLAQWTLDEELALAGGVPVRLLRYSMILLIAGTVILSTRVVGVLLVTALLIMPGASGCLLAATMWGVIGVSLGMALLSVVTGLFAASVVDVPPGPAVVLVLFVFFACAHFLRSFREGRGAQKGTVSVAKPS